MRVMTFNIRCSQAPDGVNGWEHRRAIVRRFLAEAEADIIAFQEVTPSVRDELAGMLTGYEVIGKGRLKVPADNDEINLVAYKKDSFALEAAEHFWLSDTPEQPGSMFDPQDYWPRTCTAVRLKMNDGKRVEALAMHFDCTYPSAREKAFRLAEARSASMRGHRIVLGDFNALPDETAPWFEGWRDLTVGLHGTYHEYGKTAQKIDYILTDMPVERCRAQCVQLVENGVHISDHYPVLCDLILG